MWPLCVFLATLIQQGSTCTQSVWRWVHTPVGPVSLITVIHQTRQCFDGVFFRVLWYDDANMWPFLPSAFSNILLKFTLLESTITGAADFCAAVLRAAFISLTSAFSPDVIRSCKWQLLAWSRIHQGGVACWPSPPPPPLLIGKTHSSPSGQRLTKWWISSPISACWSIVTPTFGPTRRVDIGICHSGSCAPESHNCWLVKCVLALRNN